jgi:hypothetical protein
MKITHEMLNRFTLLRLLKYLCFVGSVAIFANEVYAASLAQLPYLTIIPAHFV